MNINLIKLINGIHGNCDLDQSQRTDLLEKEVSIQVEEAQRTPKEQYQKRNSQHNIIVKTLNTQNNNKKGT